MNRPLPPGNCGNRGPDPAAGHVDLEGLCRGLAEGSWELRHLLVKAERRTHAKAER